LVAKIQAALDSGEAAHAIKPEPVTR